MTIINEETQDTNVSLERRARNIYCSCHVGRDSLFLESKQGWCVGGKMSTTVEIDQQVVMFEYLAEMREPF